MCVTELLRSDETRSIAKIAARPALPSLGQALISISVAATASAAMVLNSISESRPQTR